MAAPVAPAEGSEPKVKPTRPDEETFKASLAQAEKEHAAVQAKLVCSIFSSIVSGYNPGFLFGFVT
jgi:hypothetical protein